MTGWSAVMPDSAQIDRRFGGPGSVGDRDVDPFGPQKLDGEEVTEIDRRRPIFGPEGRVAPAKAFDMGLPTSLDVSHDLLVVLDFDLVELGLYFGPDVGR
jgi:hypothetical protein